MPLYPNPDIVRDRDVIVFSKASAFTVMIDATMKSKGWQGGQGVQWAASTVNSDTFIVTFSDGIPAGFLLWGSNESSDQFISYTQNQPTYQFASYCFGPWVFSTRTFEQYTYASRQAGPLVPLTYTAGEPLLFSLRGFWTKEDEWALSGDPRAPNEFIAGSVAQVPSSLNNNYLGVQAQM
jgi:hypothetical protein